MSPVNQAALKDGNVPANHDWAEFTPLQCAGITLLNAHFTQHRFERHSHETYSIGFTRSGVQTFACRGTRHASLAGDLILFNPDEPHDGSRGGETGFGYSILYIDRNLVHDWLDRASGHSSTSQYFKSPVVHDPRGVHLLQRAVAAVAQKQESLHAEEQAADTMMALLGRHGESVARRDGCVDAGQVRMSRVREYLDAHFAEDLKVETLAALAGLSRAHVTRAFTASFGIAPHAYLNVVRVQQAQQALANGVRLADVAATCGFADQSHLSRRFKGQVGISPGRWLAQTLPR